MSASQRLTAEQIIAALPSLPRQDRLAVRAAVDHLLQGKGSTDRGAIALYEIIAKGVGSSMPFGRVPAALQASLAASAPGFEAFTNEVWPGHTRIQHIVIARELLRLLAGDLHERQVPVSVSAIIKNLGRIQDVFDESYPNYRQAGLGALILKNWLR